MPDISNNCLYFCLFIILNFANCLDNNVCPTLNDYFTIKTNPNCWYDFAASVSVPDIIKMSGYPFIEYKILTEDGYILTVFRIPSINKRKGPVFLQHGVQCSAGIFVGLGKKSLAFLLADAGYDVWLGNYRGNEYSEEHVNLNISMKEYWNYTTHDIALIDIPAMLNLVHYHTHEQGKITYIGHSLGTTVILMYASEHPEYAKGLIKLIIFMSPSYKLSNMLSPYRLFFPLLRATMGLTNNFNLIQTISRGDSKSLNRRACMSSSIMMLICLNLVNLFTGPFTQIAPETIPVLFNQFPSGSSLKIWLQISDSVNGRFRKYDYGPRNVLIYGTSTPPEFDIKKIKIPIFMFYARNDWATGKIDALHLYQQLPKDIQYGYYEIRDRNFNHFDFVFGRNAKQSVYDKLLQVLQYFESNIKLN